MILELKENKPHGTREYPYDQYYIHRVKRVFQIPVHWHDELEIIYIRQGELYVTIEDEDYIGTEGDIFLVNPRELHLMGSMDLTVAYYTLLFPMEFVSFQTMDDLESEVLQPIRSGKLLFTHKIAQGRQPQLRRFLDEIISVNDANESLKQLRTRILLLQFMQTLMEAHMLVSSTTANRTNIQKEMLAYIQDHYREKITLQSLSGEFHLSEKYLSRYFKEHFYLTFTGYVNHLRLTCAKKLLETTDLPVTEIALRSGFSSDSYFIRTFKSCYGSSPLKYRKAIQK